MSSRRGFSSNEVMGRMSASRRTAEEDASDIESLLEESEPVQPSRSFASQGRRGNQMRQEEEEGQELETQESNKGMVKGLFGRGRGGNIAMIIGVIIVLISLFQLFLMFKTQGDFAQNNFEQARADYNMVMWILYLFLLIGIISIILVALGITRSGFLPFGTAGAAFRLGKNREGRSRGSFSTEQ